jgi:hypothetical protein
MGPFGRSARAQEHTEAVAPLEAVPLEIALPEAVEPPRPVEVLAAASSEYRRVGDDLALLTVEVAADAAAAAIAELVGPEPGRVAYPAPTSVTIQPAAGLARLTFVVDRHLPARAGDSLVIAAGPDLSFTVPPPVQRPAIGSPETEIGDAAVATLAGEELFGLITMLEKRCSVAERVAADFRAGPTDAVKLAQAYREIWDVRAMLDSREDTYRRSAELVEAAEAALRAQIAESDELAAERDDARAAAEQLGSELDQTRAAVEEWSAEAERARASLAAAVARAEELETERDEALALALEYETEATDARAAAAASAEQVGSAAAELAVAAEHAESLERERDEAYAGVDSLMEQIQDARHAAAEAESRLESERTLYEARIVAGVEAERKRSLEVEELKARLGDKRRERSGSLRREPAAIAESFVQAQRERLRHTSLDEQRAEVAALELQLERLKAR